MSKNFADGLTASRKTWRLPDELIERIKAEVPLSDLCREYGIELTGYGKNLMARCPFHEDGEPSFVVTPGKNLWNCLGGCGGGDTIQLVMRCEKMSFRRAAEKLAGRLGLVPQAAAIITKVGTEHEILTAPGDALTDAQLMGIVADFYHATFCNQPQAMQYLQKRKCFHPEAVKKFKIGYANRTLGYRVPTTTAAGRELKERLQKLGVLRKETGHEHLNGSVVFPITDRAGSEPHGQMIVTQIYGRKITEGLRKGTPLHLYLEQPKRGLWNPESVMPGGELILCEAVLDALTFWCAGFRNVTCTFGVNGINEDLWALLHDKRPRWIVMAQDNDKAGNDAVEKLAPRLAELGIGVKRAALPPDVDVNALACQSADASKALAVLLEEASVIVAHATSAAAEQVMQLNKKAEAVLESASILDLQPTQEPLLSLATPDAAPPPQSPESFAASREIIPEQRGEDLFFKLGDREYRVRGLAKNTSFDALKINLRVRLDDDRYHQDNVDMARAKEREHFARVAALEASLKEDVIKRDLSRLLLKLEELQEESIRRALQPRQPEIPGMSEAERNEALALLRDPKLLERILADFDACGVVGEDTNKLVGYLAALSRKFDKPLGVIIQSSSAAGKTTLMEAVLSFIPEEERVKYSAMTGQALFYLGEADIKNKILAIAEEEGAERATYALKLLQSEGELTIASTGKDATTGRLVTETYHVEGPAMIFFTTTSIEIDEELANRCLTLTVDESREQTRRIHELQREEETIEGHLRKVRAAVLRQAHRNAQRLLQALPVHNPFARRLTFPDENTRLRRDQKKYLTLIRAIALLHQHQRPRRKVCEPHGQNGVEHVEVTLEDIAVANRLASEVLGRSLDEMPPQTRAFLDAILAAVRRECGEKQIEQRHYRFSQRDVRGWTNASPQQVKRHLAKLVDLEYALIHRGGRGQSFVYELLYSGEGDQGGKFVMGLIDVEKLKCASPASDYEDNRDMENGHRDTPGSPQVQGWDTAGSTPQNGLHPSKQERSEPIRYENPQNARLGRMKTGGAS
jgi:DNA primase